jgi:outer membrane lipoprotein carrier protein
MAAFIAKTPLFIYNCRVMNHPRRPFIWLLLALSPCLAFSPPSPQQAALNIEKAFASLRSLRADFEQSYYPASMATPLEERGRLYLQKPDLMRWEYLEPEPNTYVYKEGVSQAYFPEDNQLFRHVLSPEEKDYALFSLLTGRAKIADDYLIEPAEFPSDRKSAVQIKLVPKTEGELSHILLEADPRTWLLNRVIVLDWAGNKQEFRFSGFKLNPRLDARVFELEVPADVEVIDGLSPLKK